MLRGNGLTRSTAGAFLRRMRKLLMVVVVSMSSCATFYATPVSVTPGATSEGRCIDRLLTKSRNTGYVEQTVDKDTGFFRVVAKSDAKGKAAIGWFNVACDENGFALVTPVGARGALSSDTKISKAQRRELDEYASALESF